MENESGQKVVRETAAGSAGVRRERPGGPEDGGGGRAAGDGVAVVHEPVEAAPPPAQPSGHRQLPLAQVAEDQGLLQQESQVRMRTDRAGSNFQGVFF